MTPDSTPVTIAIPVSLKREIEQEAHLNVHSLSDEIIARLRNSFEYERKEDETEQRFQELHALIEQLNETILVIMEEKAG